MCEECNAATDMYTEHTTEFQDWAVDGLRKAEEMLNKQTDNPNKE